MLKSGSKVWKLGGMEGLGARCGYEMGSQSPRRLPAKLLRELLAELLKLCHRLPPIITSPGRLRSSCNFKVAGCASSRRGSWDPSGASGSTATTSRTGRSSQSG